MMFPDQETVGETKHAISHQHFRHPRTEINLNTILRTFTAIFLSFMIVTSPAGAAHHAPVSSGQFQLFATESAAQSHCPRDTVVWLNTNSGIYHEKGMRWYGRTHAGAYVCKAEADAAGDRDTRNGQ